MKKILLYFLMLFMYSNLTAQVYCEIDTVAAANQEY
jgi:hypothetical protein